MRKVLVWLGAAVLVGGLLLIAAIQAAYFILPILGRE
jgi:hypothetical protein